MRILRGHAHSTGKPQKLQEQKNPVTDILQAISIHINAQEIRQKILSLAIFTHSVFIREQVIVRPWLVFPGNSADGCTFHSSGECNVLLHVSHAAHVDFLWGYPSRRKHPRAGGNCGKQKLLSPSNKDAAIAIEFGGNRKNVRQRKKRHTYRNDQIVLEIYNQQVVGVLFLMSLLRWTNTVNNVQKGPRKLATTVENTFLVMQIVQFLEHTQTSSSNDLY